MAQSADWIQGLKTRASRAFWMALAVLFLIESWLWDNVKEWLRWLEKALGLERFETWLKDLVARLSPQMTLALFAVPMLGVAPFKLIALALLAKGYIALGVGFVFFAKTLTLGVEAFLFDICRDKLLEMQWFGVVYSFFLDARVWANRLIAPYKTRLAEVTRALRARVAALLGEQGGDIGRRIARLRERAKSGRWV